MKIKNDIYHILAKRWQGVKLAEVVLGLLDSVHARVDGPHEGLLGRGLQTDGHKVAKHGPGTDTALYTKQGDTELWL